MRNILSPLSIMGALLALAIVAAPSTGLTAPAEPGVGGYLALGSQDQAGFGATINFTESDYTPPGILPLFRRPLASQNQTGFGDAINFTASAYTPPGIASRPIDVVAR